MKKSIIIFGVLLTSFTLFSQGGVSINNSGTPPNPNSMLDVASDDKGVLITRLTTTARVTLGGALGIGDNGMLVYDKDLLVFYYWDGTQWVLVGNGIGSDDQNLTGATLTGTTLQIDIEDGTSTSVDLAPLQDGVNDADADATNEIQDLSLNTTTNILTITNNGTATSIDLTPYIDNTDAQDLSLTGDILSLTGDGTTVDLAPLKDHDWYEVGGTTQADAITDDIFTQGNVGIGESVPKANLDVDGDILFGGVSTIEWHLKSASGRGILASGPNYNAGKERVNFKPIGATGQNFQLAIDDASSQLFPNYSFISDPNTGMFNRANNPDKLYFSTNGIERQVITDVGNVGIGTNLPTSKLDINGDLRVRTIPSGTSTEEVLVVDATGVVKKVAPSSPAGEVITFAGSTAPTGFLLCDGSAVSRTTYANLFAVVGTTYGAGNGTTTFNLPDLRGEFIRGFDAGRGVDIGRVNGSWQKPTVRAGNFDQSSRNIMDFDEQVYSTTVMRTNFGYESPILNGYSGSFSFEQTQSPDVNLANGTILLDNYLHATRPRNIAMNYCIKF